jgi:hypothetical protein
MKTQITSEFDRDDPPILGAALVGDFLAAPNDRM